MTELCRIPINSPVKKRIQVNYENLSSQLGNLFEGRENPFAVLSQTTRDYIWYASADEVAYKSLQKASPDELDLVMPRLKALLDEAKQVFARSSNSQLTGLAAPLLNVPDESWVYFSVTPDEKVRILLAGWGFTKPSNETGINKLEQAFDVYKNRHQNVILQLGFNRIVAANREFVLDFFRKKGQRITTDAEGMYEVGEILAGNTFDVTCETTGETRTVEVEKGKERYPVAFSCATALTVRILNQYDEPVAGYPVRLTFGAQVREGRTGSDGTVPFDRLIVGETNNRVRIEGDGWEKEIALESESHAETIRIDERFTASPQVTAIDQKGNPVPHYSLTVTADDVQTLSTDADGTLLLHDRQVGTSIRIGDGRNERTYRVERSGNAWTFPVEQAYTYTIDVRVTDQRQVAQPDYPLRLSLRIPGSDGIPDFREYRTGPDGFVSLGSLPEGAEGVLTDGHDPARTLGFRVSENTCLPFEIYRAEPQIEVIDQKGAICPDYTLQCLFDGRETAFTTQADGVIRLGEVFGKKEIIAVDPQHPEHKEIYRTGENEDRFVFRTERIYRHALTVRVTNQHDEVQPDYPVRIDRNRQETQALQTGPDGTVRCDDLPEGVPYRVSDGLDANNFVDGVAADDAFVGLRVVTPEEKTVRIRVFDLEKRPLPFVEVSVRTKKGVFTERTDADGYIYLPADRFVPRKKFRVTIKVEE